MTPHRHPDAWPETMFVERQPEAAHAASEYEDDDNERQGHVLVTALCIFLTTAAIALLSWAVITHW
jgi:hypothetical protein